MKRREFIAALGGAAAWPLVGRAQQQMPTVGFLSLNPVDNFLTVFRQNLKAVGYVEGQNVAIQYTSAQGRFDDLRRLATDLVDRKVPLIVAGDIASALAVRAASSDVIIVFLVGADPVKLGLVNSLNRPNGNATGIAWFIAQLEAKRIGLLHELRPDVPTVAALLNPNFPPFRDQLRDIQDAVDRPGVKLLVATVNVESEFDTAFTMLSQSGAKALLVLAVFLLEFGENHFVGEPLRHPRYVRTSGLCHCGRPNELRNEHFGDVWTAWHLRRSNSER
jgi:putative tryptophan/tyrosine transport system substrate-binding protein